MIELPSLFISAVLIVAKCIVNNAQFDPFMTAIIVLIVAKCIVNMQLELQQKQLFMY